MKLFNIAEELISNEKSRINKTDDKKPSFISSMKNITIDTVAEKSTNLLESSHEILTELNKVGFKADKVIIGSGIAPSLAVVFKDTGETGSEGDILDKNKHIRIFSPILKLLLATRKFHANNYKLETIKVDFSIPPKVVLVTTVTDL